MASWHLCLVVPFVLGSPAQAALQKKKHRYVISYYYSRQGEKLSSVARQIYGSSDLSSLNRVRKNNPHLSRFRDQQILPMGTRVKYFQRKNYRKVAFVHDPSLMKRLVERKYYQTQSGDTLRKMARLFYGHRTWWKLLKEDNVALRKVHPDQVLKVGTKIQFRSPRIESEYLVQSGDWLVRIALWKYGSTQAWSELLKANNGRIDDPDLIRPGDRLNFSDNGTITLGSNGKVLMKGLETDQAITADQVSQPEAAPVLRTPAVQEEVLVVDPIRWSLWLGILALFAAVYFFLTRAWPRLQLAANQRSYQRHIRSERDRTMDIDVSMVDSESVGEDSGPSYHTLTRRWWIKWMQLLSRRKN